MGTNSLLYSARGLCRLSDVSCVASKASQSLVLLWNTEWRHEQHAVDCSGGRWHADLPLSPAETCCKHADSAHFRLHHQGRVGVLRNFFLCRCPVSTCDEKRHFVWRRNSCSEPQMRHSPSQSTCREGTVQGLTTRRQC